MLNQLRFKVFKIFQKKFVSLIKNMYLCCKNIMIEFLRHAFGLCGEGHPSVLYGLGIIPFLSGIKNKSIEYLNLLTSGAKKFLKYLC